VGGLVFRVVLCCRGVDGGMKGGWVLVRPLSWSWWHWSRQLAEQWWEKFSPLNTCPHAAVFVEFGRWPPHAASACILEHIVVQAQAFVACIYISHSMGHASISMLLWRVYSGTAQQVQ